jgi:hypothetical protein
MASYQHRLDEKEVDKFIKDPGRSKSVSCKIGFLCIWEARMPDTLFQPDDGKT